MSIRPALVEDAPQVRSLLRQLGYPHTDEALKHRLEMFDTRPDTIVLVAEDNSGKLSGCIQVVIANRLAEGPYGEIAGLVIAEGERGHGIGRQLVAKAADWLMRQGMSRLRVRCNAIREDAHGFYTHLGFRITKSQIVFDRNLPGSGKSPDAP